MPTRSSDRFPTLRTEGAILPADLLQRIAAGESGLNGLTPASYHLIEGEKLNEATNRAWNRLLGVWTAFENAQERLPPGDHGTSLTRERWLLPLWQELGYGRLPHAKPIEIDGKSYAVSHHWQNTPIHLVACRIDLDRRTPGVAGAAQASPHGLVQELLNRSESRLWGFVSNGLKLRILRDNVRLTRQAYVEFDLESMFEGKVYADFALLWRLCHQSRVEAEKPQECWLEQWSKAAQQQGLRALDQLRIGVEQAIAVLGSGFLACPANQKIRDQLRAGKLDAQDYYRQLLRLVYRLLFLFVAEDRDLLFDPQARDATRERYLRFYSTARLRYQAERLRGSQHTDLYEMLHVVMSKLGTAGCPELGLPALGSFLFSSAAIPDLEGCRLSNADLLATVRALAVTSESGALRPVDYRNLGSEELGSIYESLLELHPVLNSEAGTFELRTASGHERKTTGSYYTPTSLITCLLDSALDPVLNEAVHRPDPEKAILNLKVCDPACGSGHFLIAAAHRLAKRLAALRTGEEEPPPLAVRTALRDVIGRCVYGVDLNPMAVELCKVALWMEALVPGKPLSFLDHHMQCGNSLLGATPALLAGGIPDEAFAPIEGDDKKLCAAYRKQNKQERADTERGQAMFPWEQVGNFATAMMSVETLADDSIGDVRRKQERYEGLVRSSDYLYGRLWADAWCAAFVWKKSKDDNLPYAITEALFRRMEQSPFHAPPWMQQEIQRLAQQYRFFHWHLAFPDVFLPASRRQAPDDTVNERAGWSGGFDVVLGNPPWERIKLQEKEWFAECRPDIANAANAAARRKLIDQLRQQDPALHAAFLDDCRRSEGERHFARHSERYPLCGRGDVNTYALFAETNRMLIAEGGRAGFIIQSDIVTADTYKEFFGDLLDKRQLVSFFDFVNTEALFPHVHRTHPHFCLITLSGRPVAQSTDFAFWNTNVGHLADEVKHFTLSAEDISLLNPNTLTCPVYRSRRDAELTKTIHRRVPALLREKSPPENPWGVTLQRMFHMADDSEFFRRPQELRNDGFEFDAETWRKGNQCYVRLYEAKMIHLFDHRWGSSDEPDEVEVITFPNRGPSKLAMTRYFLPLSMLEDYLREKWHCRWLVGWRDITNTTNERTLIASAMPWAAVGHTCYLLFPSAESERMAALLLANLSAFVLDFAARQKIGGTHMNQGFLKQLPVLAPTVYTPSSPWSPTEKLSAWLLPRVLELTYTAWDLESFAKDCGYVGPPFKWDEERRFLLRCELDAAYFHLYLGTADEWRENGGAELLGYFPTPRDAAAYIMDTFPIVKRKDEEKHGEYRTKRVILEVYDALAEAARTGQAYQTRLDPPPADPRVAHPPRPTVAAETRQTIQMGRVASYIVLLLRTWNKPVARAVLEPAIVLMLNDAARSAILRHSLPQRAKKQLQQAPQFVSGLDHLLEDMQTSQFIITERLRRQQAFRVGPQAPSTDQAPLEDVRKVKETLQALDILGEDRALLELEEAVHERYDLVPG